MECLCVPTLSKAGTLCNSPIFHEPAPYVDHFPTQHHFGRLVSVRIQDGLPEHELHLVKMGGPHPRCPRRIARPVVEVVEVHVLVLLGTLVRVVHCGAEQRHVPGRRVQLASDAVVGVLGEIGREVVINHRFLVGKVLCYLCEVLLAHSSVDVRIFVAEEAE